jgi:hypothetical protein
MIETAADHYSEQYNIEIKQRLGTASCIALYIEASDLARLQTQSGRPHGSSIRSQSDFGVRRSSP